jgi:O-antigen/teichoic acid export membrane protein
MSLTQRFARGVFWNLVGLAASRFFTFIAALVTARFLGKHGFGELGMITCTVGTLGSFAGFGIGLTANKYVAELKQSEPERAARIIALSNLAALFSGLFLAFTCVLIAPWLAQKTLNAPHLSPMLQVGAIIIPASALLGVQTGTLSGFQAFRHIAMNNLCQGLLLLPLTIALVYYLGLLGAILALAIAPAAGVVMAARTLKKLYANSGMVIDYRQCWAEKRVLWNFTLPGIISVNLINPVTWASNAILVNQPNGYAEMGLFSMANQLRMLILFLPNVIGSVLIPFLSEIHGQSDQNYFARIINLNLKTIWSLVLPLGFLIIGFSYWLVALYGPHFLSGRPVFTIMVFVSILSVVNGTVRQALFGAGNMWTDCLGNVWWGLVLMISVWYLAPQQGSMGLALSYVMADSLLLCLLIPILTLKFGHASIKSFHLLAFFTFLALIFAWKVNGISNALSVYLSLIFCLISLAVGWVLIPKENRYKIISAINSLRVFRSI